MKKDLGLRILIPTVYVLGITVFAFCLVALFKGIKTYSNETELERLNTVFNEVDDSINKETINNALPVIKEEKEEKKDSTIIKPYKDKNVKLSKSYYDEKDEESSQEKSIIIYGNTYIQNLGSEYTKDKSFDVLAVLEGNVTSISKDDNTLYTVEIKHENDLITTYQYLEEVNVTEGSTINKGDVIGKTGKSNINRDNKYTLHFEVTHRGININPENLYTMKVEDFK